jgi:hypothetical protein
MHWNGRQADLARFDPFLTPVTVQDAIAGCNNIMTGLDPKRALSQRTFAFQTEIINRPDKPIKAKLKVPTAPNTVKAPVNISA